MHTLPYPESPITQINLNATDEADPFKDELNIERVNQQFRQESRLKGVVREFTIFNESHLHQRLQRKHRASHEFHIGLELLNATPRHEFILAYDWLITSVISTLVTLLMLYICWFSTMQMGLTTAYLITAFSVSFCLITLLSTILKTENLMVFYSRHGHVPIVELINHHPDRNSLNQFVGQLSQHIAQAQQESTLGDKEQLSLELQELRRLQNEAIISPQRYEQAKEAIFNHQAYKSPA